MNAYAMKRQAQRLVRNLKAVEAQLFGLIEEVATSTTAPDAEWPWPEWMRAIACIKASLLIPEGLARNAAIECGWNDGAVNDRAMEGITPDEIDGHERGNK